MSNTIRLLPLALLITSCAAFQREAEPIARNLLETCNTGKEVCADVGGTRVCGEPIEIARLLVEYADALEAVAPIPPEEPTAPVPSSTAPTAPAPTTPAPASSDLAPVP